MSAPGNETARLGGANHDSDGAPGGDIRKLQGQVAQNAGRETLVEVPGVSQVSHATRSASISKTM